MKQKKDFKYHLKNYVRDDLSNLSKEVNFLLLRDLPALFKVYSHLVCCTKFQFWFKKVYK